MFPVRMRMITFCFMLALVSCKPITDDDDGDGDDNHGNAGYDQDYDDAPQYDMSTVYMKVKKLSGSGFGSGGMCASNCMHQLKSRSSSDIEFAKYQLKRTQPYFFPEKYEADLFTKYCQIMNGTIDCVDSCSDSPSKELSDKVLDVPRFMCVDSKFSDHRDCYDKVNKEMIIACHTNVTDKCGTKKSALEIEIRKNLGSNSDVENLLKKTCEYMLCFMQCQSPRVIEECGQEANGLLETYEKKTIDSMRDVFRVMGVNIEIPSVCNRIGVSSAK